MNPLVSIVIPTYNRVHLLCETIESVSAQTYFEWECIIIDDGSTDHTFEVVDNYIKNDTRFRYYKRPVKKAKGPSSCRNFGIEKANGEFIVFLDSDDLLTKKCIENRVKFAQFNPDYDLWIFKTKVFERNPNEENIIFNTKLDDYSDETYKKLFFEGFHPFCVCSPLWRIEKIKTIGGFDEKLKVAEDPELHMRAFLYGLKSATTNSLEYDTLYRMDVKEKVESKNTNSLIKKRNNSLYILFKKYLKESKKDIQLYSFNFFSNVLINEKNIFDLFRFYMLYIKFKIWDIKQILLIPVLIGYKILGIDSINGLGFYKLKKKTFRIQ